MDTKYFAAALDELREAVGSVKVGDLTLGILSGLMRRAQELKDADAAARAEERGTTIYHDKQ